MLTPGELYLGVDVSNWQGSITDAQLDAIVAWGARYVIVRLDCDLPDTENITREQCDRFRSRGLPVMGYCWAYFGGRSVEMGISYAQQAKECGIGIVAVDIEDNTGPGSNWAWCVTNYKVALERAGLLAMGYTYLYWPASNDVSLDSVSFERWWLANANNQPYVPGGPRPQFIGPVIGHQYGYLAVAGISVDLNAFIFDAEMCTDLNAQIGTEVTEDDVRRIVAEELNKVAAACGTDAGFSALLQAVVARIGAAGKALDLTQPIPALNQPIA